MAELTRSTLAALHPDTANANKGTQRGRGALDGGNMLTGDFRKWAAFADVPEQWPHLYDEFWDGRGMPETFMPLESLTLYSDAPRCIWLYGNGLIDLRTAQVYLAYCEAHHG